MIESIKIREFLNLREEGWPIVDVRSPKEYELSHIPGALNIPIFSNTERELIGTLYKKINKEAAMIKALEVVGPKMVDLVKAVGRITRKKEILIHCWRGGMRSQSMAWLFSTVGYHVKLLEGGYKTYRRHLIASFEKPAKLLVLGGKTGSGKSCYLDLLAERGEQVIHLEKLAHHKGSAFGAIGQAIQPTTQQFENNLFDVWKTLDLNQIIWVEDESAAIGKVSVPSSLFNQIRSGQVIELDIPAGIRSQRINKEYGKLDQEELIHGIEKISKRLGGMETQNCIEAVKNNEVSKAIPVILRYYDKAYNKGLDKRDKSSIHRLTIPLDEPVTYIEQLISLGKEIIN